MKKILIAALALVGLLLMVAPTLAQDVVVQEKTILQQVIDTVIPIIMVGLGGVLLLIINSVAGFIKDKFGIDIEARHREALHSALITGIRMALVRLGWLPGTPVPQTALTMAVAHAHKSVPDAIVNLRASDATMTTIAESKVAEATAEVAASGPEAVTVK